MKTFYLGYTADKPDNLVEFKDAKTADWEAEEWVRIEDETLEEAKEGYEEAFLTWQKNPKGVLNK